MRRPTIAAFAAVATMLVAMLAANPLAAGSAWAQEAPPTPTSPPAAEEDSSSSSLSPILMLLVPSTPGDAPVPGGCLLSSVLSEAGVQPDALGDEQAPPVALQPEGCNVLAGLLGGLTGMTAADTAPAGDLVVDDDDSAGQNGEASTTEDGAEDSATEGTTEDGMEDSSGGTDDSASGATASRDDVQVLILPVGPSEAGGENGVETSEEGANEAVLEEGGCTLRELIVEARMPVPMVETDGQSLQGVAEVPGFLLPADVCAVLRAVLAGAGQVPETPPLGSAQAAGAAGAAAQDDGTEGAAFEECLPVGEAEDEGLAEESSEDSTTEEDEESTTGASTEADEESTDGATTEEDDESTDGASTEAEEVCVPVDANGGTEDGETDATGTEDGTTETSPGGTSSTGDLAEEGTTPANGSEDEPEANDGDATDDESSEDESTDDEESTSSGDMVPEE